MNHIQVIRTQEVTNRQGYKVQNIGELTLFRDGTLQKKLFECKTLEKGYINNAKNVSAIPPAPNERAIYKWEVVDNSPLFSYPHIHILDVPKRKWIKIHIANRYDQLKGCIAVGMKYGNLPNDDIIDVLESRKAMEGLMDSLTTKTGTIEIISAVRQVERTHCKNVSSQNCIYPRLDDLDIDLTL